MSRGAGLAVGLATALVILAISIVPFLTPPWMSFAQGRAEVSAWTGWGEHEIRFATNAIVWDLIFGGDFRIDMGSDVLLSGREESHMLDVQKVFQGFYALALAAVVGLVLAFRRIGPRTWIGVRGGAIGLMIALVVAGVVLAFAFDAAFAIFHALFFASGSWTFDPATDRLVQLFPDQFWFETTAAVSGLALVLALGVVRLAGARRG